MKHISILPLYDATLTSIDSSHQLFSRINDFMKYQGKQPFYSVEIVGVEKKTKLNNGLYNIYADNTIDQIKKTDVIVIPLLCGDFPKAITKNKKYIDWVKAQYHNNAEIVCLCVGSFFLASTGLLKDRQCAVHWAAKNEFKTMFPDVKTIDDTIITDEKGIYTCGGGYSYLNLLLYIIEKHLGREISILASKMFEIDIERKSQNPFMIFVGQKKHGDEVILKAQEFIENSPTATFTVDEVCDKFGVGRRTFERRFKKSTGNSIVEYIQRVKVEFAKKHLETGRKTVNEIIYETGYNDIDAFRKVFKKFTDLSPIDYRKKYAV
jgi:transcriptional regulator GlxA family with amidase domain